jgi:hypothetical protein
MTISAFAGGLSAMWVSNGATVTLVESSFVGNSITGVYNESAVLSVIAVEAINWDAQLQDTIVRLEQVEFTDNVADSLLTAQQGGTFLDSRFSALVYSDFILDVVSIDVDSFTLSVSEPLDAVPVGRRGISRNSAWLRRVQQVRFFAACFFCIYHFR